MHNTRNKEIFGILWILDSGARFVVVINGIFFLNNLDSSFEKCFVRSFEFYFLII